MRFLAFSNSKDREYFKSFPKRKSLWGNAWQLLLKNKAAMFGMSWMALLILSAAFAPLIAPYGFSDQNLTQAFLFPNFKHLLGTDHLGRDILSRLMYGGRVSLSLGLISISISWLIGGSLGAISGFYGGKVDNILMRFVDVFQSIPGFLLSIAIAATLGSGVFNCMIAVGIGSIPPCARLIRGSILSIREMEYIDAARSINARDKRIIFKHILPNVLAPIIVTMTMSVGGAMLMAASLSFIGLGVQPPNPEWGAMLSSARNFIREYWYMPTFPGLLIFSAVLSLNIIGDGLRDALDPRLRG